MDVPFLTSIIRHLKWFRTVAQEDKISTSPKLVEWIIIKPWVSFWIYFSSVVFRCSSLDWRWSGGQLTDIASSSQSKYKSTNRNNLLLHLLQQIAWFSLQQKSFWLGQTPYQTQLAVNAGGKSVRSHPLLHSLLLLVERGCDHHGPDGVPRSSMWIRFCQSSLSLSNGKEEADANLCLHGRPHLLWLTECTGMKKLA